MIGYLNVEFKSTNNILLLHFFELGSGIKLYQTK